LSLRQFLYQNSKSSLGCGWDDSVAEEAQFVGAVVTGNLQLGIVQPTGKPISVSTQRGFNLPLLFFMSSGSIDLAPDPPSKPWAPPLPVHDAGVGHCFTISFRFFTPWPLALIASICSGVFGPWAS
jgi:hypothetical protein